MLVIGLEDAGATIDRIDRIERKYVNDFSPDVGPALKVVQLQIKYLRKEYTCTPIKFHIIRKGTRDKGQGIINAFLQSVRYLSYTSSQYPPICADIFPPCWTQAREANQSLIASNSSSMDPYRQYRADQSHMATIRLLGKPENRRRKENSPSCGCAP